jgi:putative membrane protein
LQVGIVLDHDRRRKACGEPGLFDQREVAMIAAGLVFAALAALLHVYIFTMESLTWTSARTRATFGTTAEEAETTKLLAFNQGFYNLFLAIVSGIGIAAVAMGHRAVGATLIFAGVGSMAAAAIVLLLSSPDKARAALTQGTFPVIAVVLLALGLIS